MVKNVRREHGYHRARIVFWGEGCGIGIMVSACKGDVYVSFYPRYCKAVTNPPYRVWDRVNVQRRLVSVESTAQGMVLHCEK